MYSFLAPSGMLHCCHMPSHISLLPRFASAAQTFPEQDRNANDALEESVRQQMQRKPPTKVSGVRAPPPKPPKARRAHARPQRVASVEMSQSLLANESPSQGREPQNEEGYEPPRGGYEPPRGKYEPPRPPTPPPKSRPPPPKPAPAKPPKKGERRKPKKPKPAASDQTAEHRTVELGEVTLPDEPPRRVLSNP